MSRLSRRPTVVWAAAAAAALPLLVAACGGGTAPAAPPKLADATRTVSQLSSVSAPTVTRLFRSFTLLAPLFLRTDSTPIGPVASLALPPLARWSLPPLVPLVAPRARIAAALFPPGTLGKTFVWDTTAKGYVASNDPGAPANGARFVVYAVNAGLPLVFEPSLPLTPLGYVDLTDRSAGGNAVLGITLVGTEGGAPTTYADYTLGGPAGTIASTLALAGYVSDGLNRLDLTSAFTSTLSTFTTHTTADVAAQDVHLVETAALATAGTAELSLDLSLTSGGETLRASGSLVADTVAHTAGDSFAVTVNGRPFATVSLGPHGFTYTAAPGVTLTAADEQALDSLVAASFGLFGLVLVLTIPGLALGV
jgi:hypothetical protein